MIKLYQQQYNRALRLHERLCERLCEVSGALVPVYERPHVVANKVALVQQTKIVCAEIDKMIVQIEIAEEIASDPYALDHIKSKLNQLEEVV